MIALVSVAPGCQLAALPAASYFRARASGLPAGITSAYRSAERQADMRAAYLAAYSRWLRGGGTKPTYVAPVEDSEHVTGHALDLPAGGPREWMQRHGRLFGWIRTDPNEPWHFAYRIALDTHLTIPQPAIPAPAPITPEAPLMKLIRDVQSGAIYLVGPTTYELVPNMERANALARVYGTWVDLENVDAARVRDQVWDNIAAHAANMKGQGL